MRHPNAVHQIEARPKSLSLPVLLLLLQLELCATGAASAATNHWGVPTNNVQLSITVKNSGVITTNDNIKLLVRVRNLSTNETVTLRLALAALADPMEGIGLIAVSPSGKIISNPPSRNYFGGSGRFVVVQAKQTEEFEFDLSRVIRIEEVGTYTITARKTAIPPSGKALFDVVSGSLALSVSSAK